MKSPLRTRFEPPRAPPAGLREALEAWRTVCPDRYRRLFLQGRPLRVRRQEQALFESLAGVGLAARMLAGIHAPCVRLFTMEGRFVATDLASHTDPDQVFPLMFEQDYFVGHMDVRPDDRVLELCVGSGVLSILAAERASEVAGVDVNPRALAFSSFNAALNGIAERIELLEGSLFAPVAGRRFDLVLVNPPFEPAPPGAEYFLHSHGGADGLDVVRRILAELPAHLAPEGRFEMITWSPATPAGPLLAPLLREALPGLRAEIRCLGDEPIQGPLGRFAGSPGFEDWRADLERRGIDRVEMLFVRAV